MVISTGGQKAEGLNWPPAKPALDPERREGEGNQQSLPTALRLRPSVYFLLLALIFCAALALRLVNLMDAPPLSDEIYSIREANDISRGKSFPLVEYTPYYGAHLSYLLAAFYLVVGHTLHNARLLIAILGALTPLAVFWLTKVAGEEGRRQKAEGSSAPPTAGSWASPNSGLLPSAFLSAALMLTSSSHVAVNSHVFWPTNLAPLVLALMLGCYICGTRALSNDEGEPTTNHSRGGWLVASGALAGLLLQTAPQAIAVLPGIAAHFLSDKSRRQMLARPLSHPWPYMSILMFLIVYSPLIIYNLRTAGNSVAEATASAQGYAFEIIRGPGDYLWNVRNLVSLLVRVAGSNLSIEVPRFEYFQIAASVGLLAGGIIYCWRRKIHAPIFIIVSTVLLMPVYNKGYYAGFPFQNRYLTLLLPAALCIMSIYAVEGLKPAAERVFGLFLNRRGTDVARWALVAGLALLIVLPVFSTLNYYRNVEASGRSNHNTLRILEQLEAQPARAPIELDPAWEQIKLGPGNNLLITAQVWLELRGRAYVVRRK